jgi:hypothetical protein
MGVVLLVSDRVRGQELALKRMRHDGPSSLRQLKREFRAIEQLYHPNVVSVYELGVDSLGPYLLMEAIAGRSFRAWCRNVRNERSGNLPSASAAPSQVVTLDPSAELVEHAYRALSVAAHSAGWAASTLTLGQEDPLAFEHPTGAARHPALDAPGYERLLAVLPQLLAALSYLHEHGLVHRDLKPANIMVTNDGTLKLLDFGIFGETGSVPLGAMQGTVAYVAPEQIRGDPPAPPNDLYSLGVLLFETITGHLPFVGASRWNVLVQHLFAEPPPVRALAPHCPKWLHSLVEGLLQKSPEQRLTLEQVCDVARPHFKDAAVGALVSNPPRVALVERRGEEATLLAELDAPSLAFRFIAICGASGLGKSALLERARESALQRDLLVFQSRVRFTERLPFNAIDGLVDELSSFLERDAVPDDPQTRALLAIASAAFPTLRRPGLPATNKTPLPDEIFDAVIALLERCAAKSRRLVMVCDDLQWADADSVGFLQRLLVHRPNGVILVGAVRDDTHSSAFARFWSRKPAQMVQLRRLTDAGISQIISHVARDAGRDISESMACRAAAACDGRPFFAVMAGRALARSADDRDTIDEPVALLVRDYAAQGELERRILALLAAIDESAELGRLLTLTRTTAARVDDALAPLVRERLVRVSGGFSVTRAYDFSHDLVRRQVLHSLDEHELEQAHADVAEDLERSGARPAEIVPHLLASHQYLRAADLAESGGREAEAANAFGLAADLYEVALLHCKKDTSSLRQARAVAFERSGRYLDAASEWKQLANQSVGTKRIDALLNQAKALLATRHIGEGRRTLELARREAGETRRQNSAAANTLGLVRFLAGPAPFGMLGIPHASRAELPPSESVRTRAFGVLRSFVSNISAPLQPAGGAAPPTRKRELISSPAAERDVFLGTMIGYFDPPAGIRQLLAARRAYLSAGILVQAAEVEFVLAYIAYFAHFKAGRSRLAERYLTSARRRFGGQVAPEHGRPYALDWMVQGVRATVGGEWDESARALERSSEFYEAILGRKGSFEHQFTWVLRMHNEQHRQDLAELERTLRGFRIAAEHGQDSAVECHLNFATSVLELGKGNPRGALELAVEARNAWPQDEPSFQRFLSHFYVLAPERFLSNGVEAWRRLRETVRTHARFMPLRNMLAPDVISHLALFEAMAVRAGAPDAAYGSVSRLARVAARATPLGRHLALRAAGYAADYVGRPAEALRWLAQAEAMALAAGQRIDVAVARYQRGIRLGGDEGRTLCTNASELLRRTGAHPMLLHEDIARR